MTSENAIESARWKSETQNRGTGSGKEAEKTNKSRKASAEVDEEKGGSGTIASEFNSPEDRLKSLLPGQDAPDVVHSGRDKENPPGDTLRYRTAKKGRLLACTNVLIKCKRINMKTSRIPPRSQPENPIIMAKA